MGFIYPTYVGMNRWLQPIRNPHGNLPHIRGDEPGLRLRTAPVQFWLGIPPPQADRLPVERDLVQVQRWGPGRKRSLYLSFFGLHV